MIPRTRIGKVRVAAEQSIEQSFKGWGRSHRNRACLRYLAKKKKKKKNQNKIMT